VKILRKYIAQSVVGLKRLEGGGGARQGAGKWKRGARNISIFHASNVILGENAGFIQKKSGVLAWCLLINPKIAVPF
jgi:hypothetical protein